MGQRESEGYLIAPNKMSGYSRVPSLFRPAHNMGACCETLGVGTGKRKKWKERRTGKI